MLSNPNGADTMPMMGAADTAHGWHGASIVNKLSSSDPMEDRC